MAGKARLKPIDVHPDVRMFVDEYSYQDTYYTCLCECGMPTLARRDALRLGTKISCGCINRLRKHPYDHLDGTYLGNFRVLHVDGVKGLMECYCGRVQGFYIRQILNGTKKSCGCANKNTLLWSDNKCQRHGMEGTPEYNTWLQMRYRCTNKNNSRYSQYGGRGITVCDRWMHDFSAFYQDMGPRPKDHSIDRIDNNGDYSPENCRWADVETQMGNRQNTIRVNIDGEVKSLRAWVRKFNMSYGTVYARVIKYKRRSLADEFSGRFEKFIKFEEANK